jgi:HTH-type transcriptional regulator/antitoxin HipB
MLTSEARMAIIRSTEDLGRVIHERRLELGYTQKQLADRAGVTRQWIASIEKGRDRAELGPVLRTIFQLGLDTDVRPAPDPETLDDFRAYFDPINAGAE